MLLIYCYILYYIILIYYIILYFIILLYYYIAGIDLMSWHGTRNVATLRGILEERGVMRASVRPLKKQRGLPGWFHSREFSQALQYSSPTLIDRIRCCILLKFDVRCCNSCSSGKVTKGGCLRYGLRGIALVPTCVVPQSIQCCAVVE